MPSPTENPGNNPADTAEPYDVHFHFGDDDIQPMVHNDYHKGIVDLVDLLIQEDHLEKMTILHSEGSVLHITRNREE